MKRNAFRLLIAIFLAITPATESQRAQADFCLTKKCKQSRTKGPKKTPRTPGNFAKDMKIK